MISQKANYFSFLILCLVAFGCAGGTRGTGARIDQTLVSGDDIDQSDTTTPDLSWGLFGSPEPECHFKFGESNLAFKVLSEVGSASQLRQHGLNCKTIVSAQAQHIKIVFSEFPENLQFLKYRRTNSECSDVTRKSQIEVGQARLVEKSIILPLGGWPQKSLQRFIFEAPQNSRWKFSVEVQADSFEDCE